MSWRVHILPFLGAVQLYQQFHLDEPWDSEHNKTLTALMPQAFQCRDVVDRERTLYLAATGPKALFPQGKADDGRKFGEAAGNNRAWARKVSYAHITDGTANTIMVVEADPGQAIIWTKPDDLNFDPTAPTKGLEDLRTTGFYALLGDGNVRFIRHTLDPDVLRHLFDPQDGATEPWEAEAPLAAEKRGALQPGDKRIEWVYQGQNEGKSSGSFKRNDDGTWTETAADGKHFFEEWDRNDQYVTLFDSMRRLFLRCYDDRLEMSDSRSGGWGLLYKGSWAKP